jgi:hypothetical protein
VCAKRLKEKSGADTAVIENITESGVLHANTGSFDCVRLAPHFAQDDSSMIRSRLAACDMRHRCTGRRRGLNAVSIIWDN